MFFSKKYCALVLGATLMNAAQSQATTLSLGSEENQNNLHYNSFQNMSVEDYIKTCMPKLNGDLQKKAVEIYKELQEIESRPINEGNIIGAQNEILFEAGYSFAPRVEVQGPFLRLCGTGSFKHVLDIGPGHGQDTIPALLMHNAQVIAVDIYPAQLQELKENVTKVLSKNFSFLTERFFFSFKRDFSQKETTVPSKYENAFDIINLSRVLHFLDGDQIHTMLGNCAKMLKSDGYLFITASTLKKGAPFEPWFLQQKEKGLKYPGIIFSRIRKTFPTKSPQNIVDGECGWVDQDKIGLPGPSFKKETLMYSETSQGISFVTHVKLQGHHYLFFESLEQFLNQNGLEIKDNFTHDAKEGDTFLSVIAQKKRTVTLSEVEKA